MHQVREARQQIASDPRKTRKPDHELGLHYTSVLDTSNPARPLGSIGLVISETSRRPQLWRFMDRATDELDLRNGLQYVR
jgi:hypothetical protein